MNVITNAEVVSILGSLLAFVGTIVLAYSMGRVFWELRFALKAISTTIESLVSGGDVYVFSGLEKRITKALKVSKCPILTGLFLVAVSILVQGYSLYLSASNIDDISAVASSANLIATSNTKSLKALNDKVSAILSGSDQHSVDIAAIKLSIESLSVSEKEKELESSHKIENMQATIAELKQRIEEMHDKQNQLPQKPSG